MKAVGAKALGGQANGRGKAASGARSKSRETVPTPEGGQVWRNRGGDLVAVEQTILAGVNRLHCRFVQPRPMLPGYLVDGDGRYFPKEQFPREGDNPFDLAELVDASPREKEDAARVGPTLGLANADSPEKVLAIVRLVVSVVKGRGKGEEAVKESEVCEVERGRTVTVRKVVRRWRLGNLLVEETEVRGARGGAPMHETELMFREGRPDWWSVHVLEGRRPYLSLFNGTVGDLFYVAGLFVAGPTSRTATFSSPPNYAGKNGGATNARRKHG